MEIIDFFIRLVIICVSITYIYTQTSFIDDMAKMLKKLIRISAMKSLSKTGPRFKNSEKLTNFNKNSEKLTNFNKNSEKLTNFNKNYDNIYFRKPFGCYSCMIFWITIIYSLLYFNIIYSLAFGVLFHLLSRLFRKILNFIVYLIERLN